MFLKVIKYFGLTIILILLLHIAVSAWKAYDEYAYWNENPLPSYYGYDKLGYEHYFYKFFTIPVYPIMTPVFFGYLVKVDILDRDCRIDSECTLVSKSCGCAGPDSFAPINKNEAKRVQARIDNFCSYAPSYNCLDVIYPRPGAICNQGKCKLVPADYYGNPI